MNELPLIFISIFVLFVLFLTIRSVTGWSFCVLCAGVFTTWLVLLIMYWLGEFQSLTLIAPLLGASALGIYYLTEQKTKRQLHVFRLPFFLTVLWVVYILMGMIDEYFTVGLFLVGLWLLFGILYAYRNSSVFNKMVEHIITCCKNW